MEMVMPEMRFEIQWPDGVHEVCYSPSLVIKDYFVPAQSYALEEFVARSRTALTIASDRVQAKYGRPCGLALGQLQQIEQQASRYQQAELSILQVKIIQFIE
jgi:uncharacterized repeat protein (TIGR04042 family)